MNIPTLTDAWATVIQSTIAAASIVVVALISKKTATQRNADQQAATQNSKPLSQHQPKAIIIFDFFVMGLWLLTSSWLILSKEPSPRLFACAIVLGVSVILRFCSPARFM